MGPVGALPAPCGRLQVVAKGSADTKWNKRYFRLTDAFLLYYRGPDSKTPAGW